MSETGMETLASIWARRRGLALLVAVLAISVTFAFALSLPNLYRSTATLLVERPDSAPVFPGPSQMETELSAMGQQILSRARLADLIRRFGLYPDLVGRRSLEALTDQMRRDIQVEMKAFKEPNTGGTGPTTAFTVSYRGSDPEKVAEVTNALAALYLEADRRELTENVTVLRQQLDEVKNRRDEQERRLGSLRGGADAPQQLAVNMAALDRLNSQLRLDIDARIRALERRAALVRQIAEADPQGADEPDAAGSRLAKLRRDLAQLRLRYSDKYPDVIRLTEEIAALERQGVREASASPAPARDDGGRVNPSVQRLRAALRDVDDEINTLRREEETLRTQIADSYRRIQSAPEQEKEYQRLSRDDQTTRDLYNALLKRYQEAQLKATGEAGNRLRVLDPAPVPRDPIAPDRFRMLFVSLFAALGLAAAAALFAEQIDASFHAVDDLRAFTRVPVLVSIPRISTVGDDRQRRHRDLLVAVTVVVGLGLILGTVRELARDNHEVVRMLAPESLVTARP